ncbi:MAG: DUF262 domain-containing HNH endonuclease family protein [Candidatus Pacearchaeota archaeon]
MENGEKEISGLFSGRKVFCIPDYQRAYSWDKKQLEDFLEDLINQRDDKTYFFGTILFQEDGKEDNFDRINIVDGQQRMTTIIIFMKIIIEYLRQSGKDVELFEDTYIKSYNKVKFRIQKEDNEFFQTYILQDNINGKNAIKTPSQKRLLFAKEFFKKELIRFVNDSDILNNLREKLENSKLLTYSVSGEAEAALIFETTNDRGKPLTKLEKTKSFLMYRSYIASKEDNPSDLLKNIFMRFCEIYRTLEKIGDGIDEDSILQYYFIAYEEWDKKRDYQQFLEKIKEKINRMIANKEYSETLSYIDKYSKELKETFDIFASILSNKSEKLRDLFLLQRIGIFYPLLIKTYQLDNSEEKENFGRVIEILEIFSFRVLSLKIKRTNDVDAWIHKEANKFNGDYDELILNIKNKILEVSPDNLFKNKLSSVTLYGDLVNSDLIYFFWKYENYLRIIGKAKYTPMSEDEFSNQDKKYKLGVEHIASQNPKVTTDKIEFEEMTPDFKDNYLHSIGNLTFDPQSANSSKGNKTVPEKDSKYFKKAPFMTQNELEEFMEDKKWTKNSIEKRKEKIIKFAFERWNPNKI